MILQALNEYYERKAGEPDSGIPRYAFGEQRISFCFVISLDGRVVHVVDLRVSGEKKTIPRTLVVPLLPSKKSSGVEASFTWGNSGYVLGVDGKGKPDRTQKTFIAFRALHGEIFERCDDEGLRSLILFLKEWSPDRFDTLPGNDEIVDANLVFRLEGETRYLHERPQVQEIWRTRYRETAGGRPGHCLVTGREEPIAKLHPGISGVWNAQPTGALLVSFNKDSFVSFGKDKGWNAPVGERAAFSYTAALNFLLRGRSRQKIRIGDTTTVFWAERKTPAESLLALLFNPPTDSREPDNQAGPEDDPATAARVREVLRAARSGMPLGRADADLDPEVRFFVLGLSPSEGRLSVRFWNVSTFGQLVERVGRHFADLSVERQYENELEFPSLGRLVLETAPLRKRENRPAERKSENVPPLLAGALMRSIMTGSRYPQGLYTAILGRIRADREVNYLRSAILKACLVRNFGKEVPVSLDPERKDTPYRLGRLFALLEKAQKDAVPGAGATIKDRYFGAASATPAKVFPQLLRLSQHHMSTGKYGGYIDRLIAEVFEGVHTFPKHLSLEDQGLFVIGYYHQRNAKYPKSERSDS